MLRKASLSLVLMMFSLVALAGSDQEVDALLQQSEAPTGVVFEILAKADGLTWAIPKVKDYSERLRAKFPNLPIAVVTHGNEQFALQSKNAEEYADVHQGVQGLMGDNVQVHVCGTYAEMKGVSAEEFPDYVDVTAAGPATINDYVEIGYVKIMVTKE